MSMGILQATILEQPCPPPGELPNPGTEHRSPVLQADSLPSEPPGKPIHFSTFLEIDLFKILTSTGVNFDKLSLEKTAFYLGITTFLLNFVKYYL